MQLNFEFSGAGAVGRVVSLVKGGLKEESNHLANLMSRVISILIY